MKLEKLTNNKIKIVFSQRDLTTNNISVKDFLTDISVSQKLLEYLLLKAEIELGFKVEDCKLLIETIKCSDGGLIFTITKLPEYNNITSVNLIYKFECFEDFLNLCIYIKNMNIDNLKTISKQFSLYFYNNTYYLFMKNYFSLPFDIINVFDEFGEHIIYPYKLEGIINEYGKIIYETNAICEGIKIIKKEYI